MAIIVKSVSISGESTVPEGKFEFSYNVVNNVLQNVSATLMDADTHDYKASFNKDNNNISINLPTSKQDTLNDAVNAFTVLCDEITSSIERQD